MKKCISNRGSTFRKIFNINIFHNNFFKNVPKYLSPKSPKPGAMYLLSGSKIGSMTAVTILI